MAKKADEILREELVKRGIARKNIIDALSQESEKSGKSFISVLMKHNISPESDMLAILAEKMGLEYIEPKSAGIVKDVVEKVPIKLAKYYKLMPIKIEDRTLTIAVSYPLDTKTLDAIRMQVGYEIKTVLASSSGVEEAVKEYYGLGAHTIEQIISKTPSYEKEQQAKASEEKIEDIEKEAGDVSVIKLVNQIILEAYKKRATDIHIEPYRGKVGFRYRIDGMLYDAKVSDAVKNFLPQILSRIKIMSNLDIVERRMPQDGRAIVRVQDKTLDLRVSFIPTPFGESVVIRVLPTTMFFDLVKLGLSEEQLDLFGSFIERPHGIIFVTGPTGSGKTTTLYACLSRINTSDKKIITIEDPIEYEMSGITQIQVSNEIGLDFAMGLRSMLRHDPDVMMVGEVRDRETAEIAIRVALTGHLVFSTLHTNDSASGATRLVEVGVEPYLVSSSVLAFVAQRLVRLICPHCKKETDEYPLEIKNLIVRALRLGSVDEVKIFKGTGCAECNNTGFFGRSAIYEILAVDNDIQELMMKKSSTVDIRKTAIKKGMKTLRQDGWSKVLKGMTTPDEILRVTQEEEGVKEEADIPVVNASSTSEVLPSEEAPPPPPEALAEPVVPKIKPESKKTKEIPEDVLGRRAYPRLQDRMGIRFKKLKHSKGKAIYDRNEVIPEHLASTKDVSAGGLLFVSNEAPPANSILDIKIDVPARNEPVHCLAKVVRVITVEPGKIYNVAVSYLDISSKDKAYMEKYIKGEVIKEIEESEE